MIYMFWQMHVKFPRLSLILFFFFWKTILVLIALSSPGPGYDTSTTLLYERGGTELTPFVRWDAIYFTETARRGYVFEQEWAFSWALTRFMAFFARYLRTMGVPNQTAESWAGIIIAHVSHLISILVLFELSLSVFRHKSQATRLSFCAACLHVVSPGGLFLSSPNAESPFSMFHFMGCLFYVKSQGYQRAGSALKRDMFLLLSGVSIGFATAARSNGILSGVYFAYDAMMDGLKLIQGRISVTRLRRLVVTILSGTLVALGAVVPQAVAYNEYCLETAIGARPWCNQFPPSIYTFVQSYYWNVGFLRYWTLSNLPLFLLAAPILAILTASSLWAFGLASRNSKRDRHLFSQIAAIREMQPQDKVIISLLAVPQALIAALTFTTSHVQIATRISSGYPVWYWWIAAGMMDRTNKPVSKSWDRSRVVVRWMVVYAMVQGGLYASFLPPA